MVKKKKKFPHQHKVSKIVEALTQWFHKSARKVCRTQYGKMQKSTLTEEIFRQIDSLVIFLAER